MTELAIPGVIAAGVGLVKYTIEFVHGWKKVQDKCNDLKAAHLIDDAQAGFLRTAFNSLTQALNLYDEESESNCSPNHRIAIAKVLVDISDVMDFCETRMSQLEKWKGKKKMSSHDITEAEMVRSQLKMIPSTLSSLQQAFNTCIHLDTHRRVSITTVQAAIQPAGEGPSRRSSETSIHTRSPLDRTGSLGGSTLVRSLTSYSASSNSSTTSSRALDFAPSGSFNEELSLLGLEICKAVNKGDLQEVRTLIRRVRRSSSATLSLRAIALLFACEQRQRDMEFFHNLLYQELPSNLVDWVDPCGRGIFHLTIGRTMFIDPEEDLWTFQVLKKLVTYIEQQKDTTLLSKYLGRKDDREGKTPLHYCAELGNCKAVKFLVGKRPTLINLTDDEGRTPLYLASHENKESVVRFLVENNGHLNRLTPLSIENKKCTKVKSILRKAELLN